jgi:hypothetical protein
LGKIFLHDEVFNTSVDKLVEKRGDSNANYTILSSLTLFALFKCNSAAAPSFQIDDDTICSKLEHARLDRGADFSKGGKTFPESLTLKLSSSQIHALSTTGAAFPNAP